MARNSHQDIPAPQGMDATTDPTLLPEGRAAFVQNLLCDRAGSLRAQAQLADVITPLPNGIDGVSWYYGATPAQDQLLIISGGQCYAANVLLPQSFPPTFGSPSPVGGGFKTGKKVRSVQYRSEVVFVQDGGLQPLRYNGVSVYQLGIAPPAAPVVIPSAPTTGASLKAGVITYKVTYYDELFRQSDLSPGTTINFANNVGLDAVVMVVFGSDPQVKGAFLYANTTGGTVFYRIATITKASGSTIYEDNANDLTVSASFATVAASPGENALPNPASVIAEHKLRLWLNDSTNASFLQISGLDNTAQWSSPNFTAADGERVPLTTNQGDPILALVEVGSVLYIMRRRLVYIGMGDDPTTFTFRPIHTRSVVSTDSAVRCDNDLWFVSEDGIYKMVFSGAFQAEKTSKEIETLLPLANRALMEGSVAWYCNNTYFCHIGSVIYAYSFDAGAWTSLTVSAGCNGANVVTQAAAPTVAYLCRCDTNAVTILDLLSTGQTVANVVYTTRSFDGADEHKRATRKRAYKTTVYGDGAFTGTVTLTVDGVRPQGYLLRDADASRGILGRQQWSPEMVGTNQQVTIAGTGVGLAIRDILHEYTNIG